ncbi:MAG: hypothetical protein ACPGWR_12405 [Ardenticatenaceae bacterium]
MPHPHVSPYYEQNPPLFMGGAQGLSRPYYEQNPPLSATPHACVRQNPLELAIFRVCGELSARSELGLLIIQGDPCQQQGGKEQQSA